MCIRLLRTDVHADIEESLSNHMLACLLCHILSVHNVMLILSPLSINNGIFLNQIICTIVYFLALVQM